MKSQVSKEVSLDTKFNLPKVIMYVDYGGKILAIAREEGNWIVLDNDSQKCFLEQLRTHTIEEAMKLSSCRYEDAQWVVTQIVARRLERKVRYQKVAPIMQLYLTNSCNMRCPHCYMSAGDKSENEMTTTEVKSVLSAYRRSGGRDIKMTGGEIALRKDLLEIIEYGKNLGLRIDLLTNGTLWTKAAIEKVSSSVNSVQISIDGFDENENAKVRGKGNFQKALEAVDLFVRNGVSVKVAVTANYSEDIDEKVEAFANFAKTLKKKYEGFKFDVDIATGLLPGRYGKLSTDEDAKYQKATLSMNNQYLGCENMKDEAYIKRHRSGIVLTNCSYGFPTIGANGDLHYCPVTLMNKSVANIRTTPLDQIMEMCKTAHAAAETSNLEPCRNCELKSICGGDCRLNFKSLRESTFQGDEKPTRECTAKFKEGFYEIMIRTNEDIFH